MGEVCEIGVAYGYARYARVFTSIQTSIPFFKKILHESDEIRASGFAVVIFLNNREKFTIRVLCEAEMRSHMLKGFDAS